MELSSASASGLEAIGNSSLPWRRGPRAVKCGPDGAQRDAERGRNLGILQPGDRV